MQTTGYICQDAIGHFQNNHGDDITANEAREGFRFYPATAALLADVRERGGAISWGTEYGAAMTNAEAEAHRFPGLVAAIAEAELAGEPVEVHDIDGVIVVWFPLASAALVNEWSVGVGDSLYVECRTPEEAADAWNGQD